MPADTDALNSKQFTLLYIGALHIESRDRRIKAIYIIVCAGLLGMRRIEILHLREKWIDWRIGKIEMPALDPCSCSQCWGAARDKWLREGFNELQSQGAYGDNVSFEDINNTELLEKLDSDDLCEILYKTRFSPKNDEGRTIPFGWSKRVTAALIVFFDEIGPFLDKSPKTVENFVEEAAENAEQLEPDVVQPHGLRKTGVNFFADQGFGDRILRRTVGQDGRNSLPHYLHDSYRYNTHIFYHIFDKEDEAPPVVSEGEKPFPVAHEEKRFKNEPFDPTHYDENRRFTRAKDQEDTNHFLIHPRSGDIPRSQKRFPEDVQYDPLKHDIPHHRKLTVDRIPEEIRPPTTKFSQIEDYNDDDQQVNTGITGILLRKRLEYEERILNKLPETEGYHSPQTVKKIPIAIGFGASLTAVMWLYSGIYKDILKHELTALIAVAIVGLLSPPLIIWHIHNMTHESPSEVEIKTRLDRGIVFVYSVVEKIRSTALSVKDYVISIFR